MLNKIIPTITIIILFSININALILSEMMFDPIQDENYNEWLEFYNNNSFEINIENLTICNTTIINGFKNTSKNITNSTNFTINQDQYFIISDGGTGSQVLQNFKINTSKLFHIDASSICNGLSNSGKTIFYKFNNNTYSYNYQSLSYIDEGLTIYHNTSTYRQGCTYNGTPGYYKDCNNSNPITPLNYGYNFKISNNTLYKNQRLFFKGNITNPYNYSITANLLIKIGIKDYSGGYDYPDNLILFNKLITLNPNINNITLLTNNLSWIPNSDLISGEYKAYSRLQSTLGEKRPSELFFLYNKANIFINDFNINKSYISLNNKLTLNYTIKNAENKSYNISLGFKIPNFKTINNGKQDLEIFCKNTTITKNNIKNISCNYSFSNNFIADNQSTKVYPILRFKYNKNEIIKQSDYKNIYMIGLKDLGELYFNIIKQPKNLNFGSFGNILINFSSNNYNQNITFIIYGYPKKIISNYDFSSTSASKIDQDMATNFQIKRNKTILLNLPFFIKPNCDDHYNDDNYRIRIRAFRDNKKILTKDIYVDIKDKNEYLCPKITECKESKTKTIYKKTSKKDDDSFTYSNIKFNIIYDNISDNKINTRLIIRNLKNYSQNINISSYIFSGKTKYSNVDKKTINSKSYQNMNITLKNSIIKKIEDSKEYKIMIMISSENRKTSKKISKKIFVKKQEKNKILSFYTKQKKPKEKITLFTNTLNKKGMLNLITNNEILIKNINDDKISFIPKLDKGTNKFFLLLKDNFNNTIDVKSLYIYNDDNNLIQINESMSIDSLDINTTLHNKISQNNKTLSKITSNTIKKISYSFKDKKVKRLINFSISLIFILTIYITWRRLS